VVSKKTLLSVILVFALLLSGIAGIVNAAQTADEVEEAVMTDEEERGWYYLTGLWGASTFTAMSGGTSHNVPNGSFPVNDGAVNPEISTNGGISFMWVWNADGHMFLGGMYVKVFEVRSGFATWFPSPTPSPIP
jgi:hypothetical protein